MQTLTITVPWLESSAPPGVKGADSERVRLYTTYERQLHTKRLETEPAFAPAIQRVLDADAEARKSKDVREWALIFRVPSYREGIALLGQARRVAFEACTDLGIEPSNETINLFEADVRAAVMFQGATGPDAPADWEGVPVDWRADIAGLLASACRLTEDERGPLFPPPAPTPKAP